MIKTDSAQSEDIEFTNISEKQKIQLFCYGHHPGSGMSPSDCLSMWMSMLTSVQAGVSAQSNGQLCDRAGALLFLEVGHHKED